MLRRKLNAKGADRGADEAADQQHRAELEVERAALEMRERARKRRGDDLVGAGGDRDGWRDVVEDQQRRDQESAAHAEHPRQEADRRPHGQKNQEIDRHLGDREIDAHPSNPIESLRAKNRPRSVCRFLGSRLVLRRHWGEVKRREAITARNSKDFRKHD
jgi:hypothetical protein